jgi:hypothetical protein
MTGELWRISKGLPAEPIAPVNTQDVNIQTSYRAAKEAEALALGGSATDVLAGPPLLFGRSIRVWDFDAVDRLCN